MKLNPQAQLQLAWGRRQWPQTPRIRFRIRNVNLGKSVSVDWSASDEQAMLSYARSVFNAWQVQKEDPTVGTHCKFCPYRKA